MAQNKPLNESAGGPSTASNSMEQQSLHADADKRDRVFILRLWSESRVQQLTGLDTGDPPAQNRIQERQTIWRYSLQDTQTQARRNFAGLEDLVLFLRTQIGTQNEG